MDEFGRISDSTDLLLKKGLIILIAFPALTYVFYTLLGFFFGFIMGFFRWLFNIETNGFALTGYTAIFCCLPAGAFLSFLICRNLWPRKKRSS